MTRLILVAALMVPTASCGGAAPDAIAGSERGGCPMLSAADRSAIENALGYFPDDLSPLGTAVLCNDAAAVEEALKAGADPNTREPKGLTPVLIAAALSRDPILKRLLAAGGDANAHESDTRTLALSFALSAGLHGKDWRAYETLLASGADVNRSVDNGPTVAEWAVSLGQFDRVPELLERGYRRDLPGLAYTLEHHQAAPAARPARDKALAAVKARIEADGAAAR